MIVRRIIEAPELLDEFDHFNDYNDTIRWLRGLPKDQPGVGWAIAMLKWHHERWQQGRQEPKRLLVVQVDALNYRIIEVENTLAYRPGSHMSQNTLARLMDVNGFHVTVRQDN